MVGFSRAPKGGEETPETATPVESIRSTPVEERAEPPAAEATPGISVTADAARPAILDEEEEPAGTEQVTQPTETEESTLSAETVETASPGELEDRVAQEKTTMIPAHEYTDPSTPIEAATGEEFTISLDSNPSTGYSWRIAGKVDERVVRLAGTSFIPPDSDLRGAAGTRIWTFKGAGEGKTMLSFEYLRPWENRPPRQKATFTVVVH